MINQPYVARFHEERRTAMELPYNCRISAFDVVSGGPRLPVYSISSYIILLCLLFPCAWLGVVRDTHHALLGRVVWRGCSADLLGLLVNQSEARGGGSGDNGSGSSSGSSSMMRFIQLYTSPSFRNQRSKLVTPSEDWEQSKGDVSKHKFSPLVRDTGNYYSVLALLKNG